MNKERSMQRLLSLAAAVLLAANAAAQGFPAKPVRMIVPYPAGGSTDQMARMNAPRRAAALGQPVIIENQGGGATMIGSGAAARSAPDGHTLLVTAHVVAVNTLLHKAPTYKVDDFIPVAGIASYPYVLTVHPSVPAKNVAELVDFAKGEPAKTNGG